MAAQNGKDLLVKVDMNGAGLFETVAGLRATRVSFNTESVDITSAESTGGWRELLAGAGVKTASISGSKSVVFCSAIARLVKSGCG